MKEEIIDFTKYHCTPIDSIRIFCVQCMDYKTGLVKRCTSPKCPLYPYRLRKRPKNSTLVSLKEGIKVYKR